MDAEEQARLMILDKEGLMQWSITARQQAV